MQCGAIHEDASSFLCEGLTGRPAGCGPAEVDPAAEVVGGAARVRLEGPVRVQRRPSCSGWQSAQPNSGPSYCRRPVWTTARASSEQLHAAGPALNEAKKFRPRHPLHPRVLPGSAWSFHPCCDTGRRRRADGLRARRLSVKVASTDALGRVPTGSLAVRRPVHWLPPPMPTRSSVAPSPHPLYAAGAPHCAWVQQERWCDDGKRASEHPSR